MFYCLATKISILLALTAIIAVLFFITPGCVSQRSMQLPLPRIERLKTRVASLYRAERERNAKQFYSLTSPEFQRWCNYENFVADFTNDRSEEMVSYNIRTICPGTDNEMNAKAGTQAARVEMDVLIRWPDGQLKPAKDQTDYWVYTGDDWYWSWRGIGVPCNSVMGKPSKIKDKRGNEEANSGDAGRTGGKKQRLQVK